MKRTKLVYIEFLQIIIIFRKLTRLSFDFNFMTILAI